MITFAQPTTATADRVSGGATRKAVAFMLQRAAERDTAGLDVLRTEILEQAKAGNYAHCDGRTVSQVIDALSRAPRKASELDEILATIPVCSKTRNSKYALDRRDGQGVCFLEVVERGNGRRFVNLLTGAPGGWARQNMSAAWQLDAARKIASDPIAASKRYGAEFTVCGYCGSPLSDPESVARQIGPVCATRF